MKIDRALLPILKEELLESGKIIIIYGARQSGKTTLSNDILNDISRNVLRINADEIRYHEVLSSRDLGQLSLLMEGYDVVFIDEAQRVNNIGINLKIIHDNLPNIRLLVTGSSSLDLASKIKEPLTGRTLSFRLFPISLTEMRSHLNVFEMSQMLEEWMIYGMYPGIFHLKSGDRKERFLMELSSSMLFKDILELSSIRNPSKLTDLLKLIALQTGSEVSIHELSSSLGLSHETIVNYLDLLEQSFVIFRLGGFSRNLRKEISKRDKFYFYDLGVRNSLINNFLPLKQRNDAGAIWENFIIAERMKYLAYKGINASCYFWRTYTGAEVDYVEERQGKLFAFEIKLKKSRTSPPLTWKEEYGSDFMTVNMENFQDFVV